MITSSKQRAPHGTRPRVVAALLLALIAHAVLACVVHHHEEMGGDQASPGLSIVADCGHSSKHTPVSSADSECLTCRLHRTSVADNRSPSFAAELGSQPVSHETLLSEPLSNEPHLLLSDRAPPLA